MNPETLSRHYRNGEFETLDHIKETEEKRDLAEKRLYLAVQFIEKLARRDCGCTPICLCDTEEAMRIELAEIRSQAREILGNIK